MLRGARSVQRQRMTEDQPSNGGDNGAASAATGGSARAASVRTVAGRPTATRCWAAPANNASDASNSATGQDANTAAAPFLERTQSPDIAASPSPPPLALGENGVASWPSAAVSAVSARTARRKSRSPQPGGEILASRSAAATPVPQAVVELLPVINANSALAGGAAFEAIGAADGAQLGIDQPSTARSAPPLPSGPGTAVTERSAESAPPPPLPGGPRSHEGSKTQPSSHLPAGGGAAAARAASRGAPGSSKTQREAAGGSSSSAAAPEASRPEGSARPADLRARMEATFSRRNSAGDDKAVPLSPRMPTPATVDPAAGMGGILVLSKHLQSPPVYQKEDLVGASDVLLLDLGAWGDGEENSAPDRLYDAGVRERRFESYASKEAKGNGHTTPDTSPREEELRAILNDVPDRKPSEGPSLRQLAQNPRRREECPVCSSEWNRFAEQVSSGTFVPGSGDNLALSALVSSGRGRIPMVKGKKMLHSVRCNWHWFQENLQDRFCELRFDKAQGGAPRPAPKSPTSVMPPAMWDVWQYWKQNKGLARRGSADLSATDK
eukprot:gnl/TRDRNA2_/TRDRNA2_134238_c0_seq2.p1 gnl/TRDRNA2_/TRDRNA2_134238_c0~~gnl/TRDRNA2_/TRDRNA2_134238_c0_seq2.p1  ORF type:complete len:585 (-),score=86.43 gnl/TRDRNA2_/TRDRNA2_134238_c0_seq2:78-1742(-)